MGNKKFKIKNSLGMFDLLKGTVMIIMILMHTYGIFDDVYTHPINLLWAIPMTFLGGASMPALFIVSGYGFRKVSIDKCINKQFHTLIIPYIITMIITLNVHLVSYYLLYGGKRYSLLKTMELATSVCLGATKDCLVKGIQIVPVGPCWFLLSLFVGNVVLNQLLALFTGKKLFIALLITSTIGWLLGFLPFVPLGISQGLVAVFFIGLGYMIKKSKLFAKEINASKGIAVCLPIVVITVALKVFHGEFNMAISQYTFGLISILVEGVFAAVLIYVALLLNRFEGKLVNSIRILGRYSLYILCVHTVEMIGFGKYIQYDFATNWQGSVWIRSLIIFGLRSVLVGVGTFLLVRIKGSLQSANIANLKRLIIKNGE